MIRLLLRALATWRATELITEDELTRPIREWIVRRWPGSKLAYLVTCKVCSSVWAAAAVLVLPEWVATVLGMSAVTILLNEARDHAAQRALMQRMAAANGVRTG